MTAHETDPQHVGTIALAGATGDLGFRIAAALVARGANVRALVRHGLSASDAERLSGLGVDLVAADPTDVAAMTTACAGADCVVSALNGLRDVIVDRQVVLLDAAVMAGVHRLIPSDYSADFTATQPGRNRNFDLRREFKARADAAPIQVTSILNGAFMDMLGAEMPIIQPKIKRVLYWGSASQPMDFTMKDDVAAFTASAALDPSTPRMLRIAGGTASARQLAETMSEVSGQRYRSMWVGPVAALSGIIALTKRFAPEPDDIFPAWQGMQYMRDMFTGQAKLSAVDNDRYPELRFTSLNARLRTVVEQPSRAKTSQH
ncbi:MAG: NmrA family NAD(P)-binding protein [Nocardioidaceae bacterium]